MTGIEKTIPVTAFFSCCGYAPLPQRLFLKGSATLRCFALALRSRYSGAYFALTRFKFWS